MAAVENDGHIRQRAGRADMTAPGPSAGSSSGLDWINATGYGADPTGAADSTAAIQAALEAAKAGQTVYLPTGTYTTSSPIAIPPYACLAGSPGTAVMGSVAAGSVLQPTASFASGSWGIATVIIIPDQEAGGYPVQAYEEHIQNIMVDGSRLAAGSDVAGITLFGAVGRTSLRDVLIYRVTGWGFQDAENPVSSGIPGQLRAFNVHARQCGSSAQGTGGFSVHDSDSEWLYSSAYNCGSYGFSIRDSYDSLFNQCHAEHCGADQFFYTASYNNSHADAGGITFEACSVDGGAGHGFHLHATAFPVPPVNIVGGYIRRPGTASSDGGWAGVCVDGYFGPVNLDGVQVYPGLQDGGAGFNSPQYGLSCVNNGAATTSVTVSGGVLDGAAEGIHSDGTARTVSISPDTTFGAGQGARTQLVTPGVALQAARSAQLLPMDPLLATQATGCLATTYDRALAGGSFSPVSGTAYYRLIWLVAGVPVSQVNMWVTGTAKSGGTHGWVAIVSVASGKVVAVSADQTDAAAAWGKADAPAGISLSSPYTPALTGTYYVGFMVAATVMPTVAAADRAGGPPADLAPACCVLGGTRLTAPPAVGSAVAPREPAGGDIYFWLS
ncbi:MAG: glycosyl hydrolase family 28-related protein [Streptosporangiaceae bacterium]|jgi:hypothetical protein